ncbi:MAG: M23 family metallopeptidase [Candidatus Berkelbacteria bacterium]
MVDGGEKPGKDDYLGGIAGDIKNSRVNQTPQNSDYEQEDMPVDFDDEDEEIEDDGVNENTSQPTANQTSSDEEKKPAGSNLTQLEGESDADFQQRKMNAGQIPKDDIQAREQSAQSAVPGGKSDMSPKAERDRELQRLRESTHNIDTGKTKRNGSSLKIGLTALRNGAQDFREKFSWENIKAQIQQKIKELIFDAIKKAAQAALKSALAATSEFWLPILLGIIGVIIVVVGIIFLVKALQTPNANGSSPVQAADVINDKPWISKILALAGDKDIASKLTTDVLTGLLTDITSLETQLKNPPYSTYPTDKQTALTNKIAAIKAAITTFQGLPATDPKRAETAKNIVKYVGELIDLFSPAICHYSGATNFPVAESQITRFNNTLHGGVPAHPEAISHHNTFVNYRKGTNDAVDINGARGTPIYAAFSGTITKHYYGPFVKDVIWETSDTGSWVAVYAHLQKPVTSGHVNAGDKIGEMGPLNSPHLHLEMQCGGQPIVTTKADIIDHAAHPNNPWGPYLYHHIMSALNLVPTK